MPLLLGATLATSFLDSLNPSAIAQQLLLQAMVERKGHIRFFIAGVGLANLAMGLAVYYGVALWAARLLQAVAVSHPLPLSAAALCAGLACLAAGGHMILRARRPQRAGAGGEEASPKPLGDRIGPAPLFLMGVAFCAVKLPSAFPYFTFLAMLSGHPLAFPQALLLLAVYNFVYILPLILLYLSYHRLRGTGAIQRLEQMLGRVSAYLIPAVVVCLGAALAGWGAALL